MSGATSWQIASADTPLELDPRSLTRTGDRIGLKFQRGSGTVVLEGSSDLKIWRALVTNVISTSPMTVPATNRQHFYRARKLGSAPGTLSAPSTLQPDGEVVAGRWPSLVWNVVPSATSYHLQFSTNLVPTLQVLAHRSTNVTGAAYSISDAGVLNANRRFYWRVAASNSVGLGEWSRWATFLTGPAAAVSVLSPLGGTVNTTPTFAWSPVRGAIHYEFQLAIGQATEATIVTRYSATVSSTSRSVPTADPLEPNREYFWRVRCVDATDTGAWSAWTGFHTRSPDPAVPGVPAGLIPDGQVGVTRWPTVLWTAVQGAIGYTLQFATNGSQAAAVIAPRTITIPGTAYTVSDTNPLNANRTFRWRVAATNVVGRGPWSSWASFVTGPASPPSLLSPKNVEDVPTNPTFTWSPSRGALRYQFQIAVDQGTEPNIIARYSATVTTTSRSIPAGDQLLGGRAYFWRLQSVDSTETSPWSDWVRFKTKSQGPALPGAVSGLAPTGGSNVGRWPSLTWNPISTATGYLVQFATNAAIAANVIASRTTFQTSPTYTVPDLSPLNASRTFYWRVAASNVLGLGPWSTWANFATGAATPPAVLSPKNENAVPLVPTFVWSPSRGATRYDFQIAVNQPLDANVIQRYSTSVIGTSHRTSQGDPLLQNQNYYWRLRSIDLTETSAWCGWTAFRTQATVPNVPSTPSGLAPANGVVGGRWPTLTWNAVPNTTRYAIQFSTNIVSPSAIIASRTTSVTGTTFTVPDSNPLKSGSVFYWRVASSNVVGRGEWSAWAQFATGPAAAPAIVSPRNLLNVSITPTFIWSPTRGATRYEFQIAADQPSDTRVIARYSASPSTTSRVHPTADPLSRNRTYFWRVRAIDPAEVGPWSEWGNFKTIP